MENKNIKAGVRFLSKEEFKKYMPYLLGYMGSEVRVISIGDRTYIEAHAEIPMRLPIVGKFQMKGTTLFQVEGDRLHCINIKNMVGKSLLRNRAFTRTEALMTKASVAFQKAILNTLDFFQPGASDEIADSFWTSTQVMQKEPGKVVNFPGS